MRSFATSTKDVSSVRLQPDITGPDITGKDAGFRPWHFFVLASLMAATAAVIMSKQATPEHLILISLIIAAAGFAAAGFYRMLAPLAESEAVAVTEPISNRMRSDTRTGEGAHAQIDQRTGIRSGDGEGVGERLRRDGHAPAIEGGRPDEAVGAARFRVWDDHRARLERAACAAQEL